ncbi:hypothetical protein [Streptomyces sp. NRRL S-920]|nr:hypothetical protein [Streptomyces sp. NRRL S-920]
MSKPTPEEAGEWLRRHFADEHEPEITLTWVPGESNPAVYLEVMEILFGP